MMDEGDAKQGITRETINVIHFGRGDKATLDFGRCIRFLHEALLAMRRSLFQKDKIPVHKMQFEGRDPHLNSHYSIHDLRSTVLVMSHRQRIKKRNSISSDTSLELKGPMEVNGSVRSGGPVIFTGDFSVRERIEAYGDIEVAGNMTCNGKLKAMGCLGINGGALIRGKVKIMGKLQVVGNFQVEDEIEVWGAVIINGYMKCKKLTAYSSVTTVGDRSWYEVEETETVYGAKLIQTQDYDD